jgi:beta-hydroxylase
MIFYHILNLKNLILANYFFSIAYTHLRGRVRLGIFRQLTDHSSLLAPVNMLMYLSSAVPKTPFLDLASFPELNILRENWEIIRDEALHLYQKGYISTSEKYDDIGFNSFFRRGWKRFYLKWYGKPLSSAVTLCPKTLALLEGIPNINAVMFALLPKHSFLFKHRDPYAGSLRYHLGLLTPNSADCKIYVDGESYYWRDGHDVLFDETYVHHAENKTEHDRIILFCDIQRPLNNRFAIQFNRIFSRAIMKAASSKNLPTESVGVINKLFGYVYQIRLLGKRLKKYNKPLYYLVKYTLFLSIIYILFS